MTNILNAQEAFAAVITGRNVLARLNFGNEPEEFAPISNFPADIYAKPHVEYCIQIETILINGFEFTKPYSLDELNAGQDVFLISHNGNIVKGPYIPESEELVSCVNNGSVQRDFENAQKHAKAIQSLLGIENDLVLKVVDFDKYFNPESKTKKRAAKKHSEAGEIKQQSNQAANDDNSSDEIISPVGDQKPTSNDVEKKTLDEIPTQSEIQTNPISFDSVAAAVVNKAKEIDEVTLENNSKKLANVDAEYEEKLATLKQRVDESKTVTEVNAVVKYTTGWTTEQLSPLLKYMHKRLEVLQQNKAAEQPSLMVRIQNAPDLTSLDALEIDVSSLDPVIQPEMMRHVRNRRIELEKASSVAINDEDLP